MRETPPSRRGARRALAGNRVALGATAGVTAGPTADGGPVDDVDPFVGTGRPDPAGSDAATPFPLGAFRAVSRPKGLLPFRGYQEDRMTETPASRLRQASKQMHLAEEGLEDPSLADDLHEAISLVEHVRSELGDSDDRSDRTIVVDRPD